ncbi:MAG TPA: M24 family metallopeptidase [Thermoanaerobaculia bacterium]|nr:M24 family metallopeptidase [Thermoanaerobaculia bacterium]
MLADRIPAIQDALAEAGVDGWLFALFQANDPISLDLLGFGRDKLLTRRCYYLVPRRGEPVKLVHRLEPAMLDHLPGEKRAYLTWREHAEAVARLVGGAGGRRIAAQYSPDAAIPTVSPLDAGTAHLLRGAGAELVSSADLVQRFAATWSPEQLAGHRRACTALHEIALAAFERVRAALAAGREESEHAVQRFILERFEQAGLHTESPPIVGVNAHSADPHFQPSAETSSPIRRGDFLLVDLWAKEKAAADSVYADITWCGVCAPAPTDRQQEVWATVAAARDAALDLVRSRYPAEPVAGYEVDDAARGVIRDAGYGERFIHRTGHSIHVSDHGPGANMDNLETHDTRLLLPWTGFSIEPGIYLEGDFGVRSEINVALTPDGAEVTGGEPQRELLRLAG